MDFNNVMAATTSGIYIGFGIVCIICEAPVYVTGICALMAIGFDKLAKCD